MKKVICINSKNFGNPDFKGPAPKEGDTLTVSWEGHCKIHNIYSYEFAEYDSRYRYSAWRFAPLSDLDETELVTEEFEEKYCVPVNR